jgi:hypothetical protein
MHGDVCFPHLNSEEYLKLQETSDEWCHGIRNESFMFRYNLFYEFPVYKIVVSA